MIKYEVIEGCSHTYHKSMRSANKIVQTALKEKRPIELIQHIEVDNAIRLLVLLSVGFNKPNMQ